MTPSRAAQRDAGVAGLRRLCAWAVERRAGRVPAASLARAGLILCDDVAAIVAASREPQIVAAHRILCRGGGVAEATILAPGLAKAPREVAASCNGMAVTWAELDEGYRRVPCHAGAYILPALLAEAEACRSPVGDVITALAVAYEITVRIASAYRFEAACIHPHGAFSAIGAAAGIACLRGYDADLLLSTITAAATMVAPGPFNHAYQGALVRNVWTSIGATAGFRAADLAPLGIGGLATSLCDVFQDGWQCRFDDTAFDDALGLRWAVDGNYHKLYACCQYGHSAVEASLALAGRLGPEQWRALSEIALETHPHGMELDVVAPATVLAAKFSMPHILAAVAVRGRADDTAFDTASLTDPDIVRLRQSVSMSAVAQCGAWPRDRPAKVTWITRDGARHECAVASARGGADRPFEDAEIHAKTIGLTAGVFPHFGKLVEAVLTGTLDDTLTTDELFKVCSGASTSPVSRPVSLRDCYASA